MAKNDSIIVSKSAYDSIQNSLKNSHSLFPIKSGEPSVQVAIIISFSTLITVILGFIFKDYLIPRWIDSRIKKKAAKKTEEELFKKYKNHLFKATQSFALRLGEIYKTRSHYLWPNAPQSSFYDYKYKSSVYRLCVLLGWIRAYRLEESAFSFTQYNTELKKICKSFDELEKSLADGQVVEMYVAKTICKIIGLDDNNFINKFEKFSISVDHLIQQFLSEYNIHYISELADQQKTLFIQSLEDIIKELGLNYSNIVAKKDEIINVVSVRLGLIYRDWQQALGDLMIQDKGTNGIPVYSVIGFKSFEEMWSSNDTEEKKWVLRAAKMFHNFNMTVDKNEDSRIKQFENVYAHLYQLLFDLFKNKIGDPPIEKDAFEKIPKEIHLFR